MMKRMTTKGFFILYSVVVLISQQWSYAIVPAGCSDICRGRQCQIISGIFTRTYLPHGYNLVTQIPAEACNITVAEMARSRNYLALKIADGQSIINGNLRLSKFGNYSAAGTTFAYQAFQGDKCPGQCFQSNGPITQSVDVQLLYYRRNPGIKYQFTIPKTIMKSLYPSLSETPKVPHVLESPVYKSEDSYTSHGTSSRYDRFEALSGNSRDNYIPDSNQQGIPLNNEYREIISNELPVLEPQNIPDSKNYYWRISGLTECSRTCGGGYQSTEIICMKRDNGVVVTKENCDPNLRPATQTIECNKVICPPEWSPGNWSQCSVSCDKGIQQREVDCIQKLSMSDSVTVSHDQCQHLERPLGIQRCEMAPCTSWKADPWEECTVPCGLGEQHRRVACVSIDGNSTNENNCLGEIPDAVRICDMGTCAKGWFHSRWSDTCSAECGSGFLTRTVYCSAEDGTPLEENKCSGSKPRERKRCRSPHPCGGTWFEGPWSPCSATCGEGHKTRDVLCIKKVGKKLFKIVNKNNCQEEKRPKAQQSCGPLPECEPNWFMTHWSQCSKSCDTGIKTREIKCFDSKLHPSDKCTSGRRPSRRKACNTQSCDVPQLDRDLDPGCQDKIEVCKLVAQARMCVHQYYSTRCCRTCTLHSHQNQSLSNSIKSPGS